MISIHTHARCEKMDVLISLDIVLIALYKCVYQNTVFYFLHACSVISDSGQKSPSVLRDLWCREETGKYTTANIYKLFSIINTRVRVLDYGHLEGYGFYLGKQSLVKGQHFLLNTSVNTLSIVLFLYMTRWQDFSKKSVFPCYAEVGLEILTVHIWTQIIIKKNFLKILHKQCH